MAAAEETGAVWSAAGPLGPGQIPFTGEGKPELGPQPQGVEEATYLPCDLVLVTVSSWVLTAPVYTGSDGTCHFFWSVFCLLVNVSLMCAFVYFIGSHWPLH